jgi:Uma2 family endonuclease
VRHVGRILELLHGHLPAGKVLAETRVVTSDGVKVTDAAWISAGYAAELEGKHPAALERAPEICVEVLSPSNTAEEMAEKSALYFEAAAQEVWLCRLDGKIVFYTPHPSPVSSISSEFPSRI